MLPFGKCRRHNSRVLRSSIFRNPTVMKSKKFFLLSCAALCILAVSPAMAQMRGHSASMPVMSSMRSPVSTARMQMQHAPMVNTSTGFRRFNDFHRNDRFHHHNRVIIIDNFGFPFFASFPFYYPYPYPYPYPYGCYGNPYGGY
jgi:hypothetical protein